MNLFFDEISQKLIIDAKLEMYELKHPYVGSEHLLLAILKNNKLDVTKMLNSYGINYKRFKDELISTVGVGSKSNEWFLFTPLLKRIINNATYYSKDNNKSVTPYSLLVSILQEGDGVANRILLGMNVDLQVLYDKFLASESLVEHRSNAILNELGVNMNEFSLNGKYDPVIGREKQIDRLIQILLRKNKNNPLLIGEAGVGKTSIVEELSRRIAIGDVPLKLKNKVIYSISMSSLVAGTRYRGEFEERVNKLISEVIKDSNIILFIDEVHTLMGAGGAEGAIDASNIIKPYLARGDLKIIGATTVSEYSKYLEKDKALDRRFQKVYIDEPNKEEVKEILEKLKPIYEEYHHVRISDKIISLIIKYSFESLFTGRQPDKSIDLLDEVCSYATVNNNSFEVLLNKYEKEIKDLENKKNQEIINRNFQKAYLYKNKELKLRSDYNHHLFDHHSTSDIVVQDNDLIDVIYHRNGIISKSDFSNKVQLIRKNLKKEIFGQKRVIDQVCDLFLKYDFLNNNLPFSMLFVGKSGVGKTFLVEKIVELLSFNNRFIKLNMCDYKDSQSLSRIIGASPGYVGYGDNCFFNNIKENPFSIILLDNINCAHSSIIDFFYKAMEDGYFLNSMQEKIFISKCIIILTISINDSSIGFVDNRLANKDDIFNKITNIINFNDISKSDIEHYLKEKSVPFEYWDSILDESNYESLGFKKLDSLVNNIKINI